MKKIVILLILSTLVLSGCGEAVAKGNTEPEQVTVTEQPTAENRTQSVPAVTNTTNQKPPEPIKEVTEKPEPATGELEPTNEPEEGTVKRYEPAVKESTEPLFNSGEIDLSQSTPEEIIIKVNYFKDGKPVEFNVGGGGGRASIRFYKQKPPPLSDRVGPDAKYAGALYGAWVKENIVRTIDDKSFIEFMLESSNDTFIIPLSALSGTPVIVEFTVDVNWWKGPTNSANFGPETMDEQGIYSSIFSTLPK